MRVSVAFLARAPELAGALCREPTDLSCVDGAGSTSTPNLGTRTVDIDLGPGSTVVCTFTNGLNPPPTSDLQLAKVTFGSTGAFPFQVTKSGGGFDQSTTLTTTNSQGENPATDVLTGLTSGTYTMQETLPTATSAGYWTATSVACVDNTGATVPTTGTANRHRTWRPMRSSHLGKYVYSHLIAGDQGEDHRWFKCRDQLPHDCGRSNDWRVRPFSGFV